MSATSSAGYGHGPCGRGPYGHGPWLVWPQTPAPGYGVEREYAVTAHWFADGSERRYLRARTPRELLTVPFLRPDSAEVAAVRSWACLLGGGTYRVAIQDPRTSRTLVGRLADDGVETLLSTGFLTDVAALRFAIERPRGYAHETYVTSPTHYWRCSETAGVSTLSDASSHAWHVGITQGGSTGRPGLLPRDSGLALYCCSLVTNVPTAANFRLGTISVAGIVKLTWPPPTTRPQPIWSATNADHPERAFVVGVDSSGIPLVIYRGGAVDQTLASGSVSIADDTAHHVAYVKNGNLHTLTIDGVIVSSDTTVVVLMDVQSQALGANPASGQYLYGTLQDVALWNGYALTTAQVERLANAARDD